MSFLLPPLPPTFEAALRDVHARTPQARIAAAERLATPEPEAAESALEGLLLLCNDDHPRVRASAVRGLRELGDERAIDRLLERLDDADPLVRELAVIALGALPNARARSALRRALRSPHAEVRFQAVASVAEAGDQADLDALMALLRDADAKVRANAARSLTGFGQGATAMLREALDDADPNVRIEAALSLARLADASGADALHAALLEPARTMEALDAVGALRLHAAREAVATLAGSALKPLVLKVAAARALLRLGDARGTDALRQVLHAWRSDGRSYAVEVVGELQVAELASEIVKLVQRPRGVDPEVIADALGALLPASPDAARAGLARLAARHDRAGERARRLLAGQQER
ncbi:MAG: HEAT repeat domain-containing protein [Polyangiales bacterium]